MIEENQLNRNQEEESFSLNSLVTIVRVYWHLFVISLILALIAGYITNRYTKPSYLIKSQVLLSNDTEGAEGMEILGGLPNIICRVTEVYFLV